MRSRSQQETKRIAELQAVQSSYRINRRLQHRYVMVQRDAFLHAGGEKVPCVVRNISSGGLLARVYRPVEMIGRVRIELAAGQLLEGTILWTRDWEVGVAFPEPIDVETIVAQQWLTESGERRKSRRVNLECPATLKVGKRFHYCRLCDLSPNGARVRTHRPLKKLGNVVLTLPDLPPLFATIPWASGTDCGLAFGEPIPAEALDRWLQERGYAGGDEPAGVSAQP